MDELDKRILNKLQTGFPIASRPYRVVADELGIGEEEVVSRVTRLVASRVIRKIGPVFDTRKLGFASTLAAMRVPPGRLDEVARIVNSYPQVTHNYGRDHEYNLWFTLVCRDSGEIKRVVGDIRNRTGIGDLHLLPAERMFKIKVDFAL